MKVHGLNVTGVTYKDPKNSLPLFVRAEAETRGYGDSTQPLSLFIQEEDVAEAFACAARVDGGWTSAPGVFGASPEPMWRDGETSTVGDRVLVIDYPDEATVENHAERAYFGVNADLVAAALRAESERGVK